MPIRIPTGGNDRLPSSRVTKEGRVCLGCDKFKPWKEFYLRDKKRLELGQVASAHSARCRECYSRNPQNQVDYQNKLKLEAFNAYGGPFCSCCGETEIKFLDLSHPDDDGKAHRAQFGGKGGYGFMVNLRKLGWPESPRLIVECSNCNQGRARNKGVCPHKAS